MHTLVSLKLRQWSFIGVETYLLIYLLSLTHVWMLLTPHCACRCAGVILRDVPDKAKTCELIKGDPTLGVFLRTATRTDVTRLGFPSTA